jgi:hypothetical protein
MLWWPRFPASRQTNCLRRRPGYQYESQELKKDFQLICLRYAHILINQGYNFQRYDRGGVID